MRQLLLGPLSRGMENSVGRSATHCVARYCSGLDGAGARGSGQQLQSRSHSRSINNYRLSNDNLPTKAPMKKDMVWMRQIMESTTINLRFDTFSRIVPAIMNRHTQDDAHLHTFTLVTRPLIRDDHLCLQTGIQ